jgi:insulysin
MAILISDPETLNSAASLNIGAGAALQPAEYPGVDHLLEHMVF